MNGMGYVPVCSSSSMSKTFRKSHFTGLLRLFWSVIINICVDNDENCSDSKTV